MGDMENTHIVIIGAGIVGLAIAEELSKTKQDIILIEQNDRFGAETSSRNSEVVHAGLYYLEGSLKAKLCVEGARLTQEICSAHSIPFKKTGKILVANSEEEQAKVHSIFELGTANGAQDLELLTKAQIAEKEPAVRAVEGMFSPHTGIVDSHRLMAFFEYSAIQRGVTVVYNCEVTSIRKENGLTVTVRDSDGSEMELVSEIVINATGLKSDVLATSAGIDIDAEDLLIK